jgi:hypothetical protein
LRCKFILHNFVNMSVTSTQPEHEVNPTITVRLEPELADFIRQIANATCNTTSGALRLCIRSAKEAGLPAGIPFSPLPVGLAKAG